jgi:sec-independent protein translocase protein TatA
MFDSKMLLVILAIALVIFGTKRLRTIGSDLGAAVKGFKQAMSDGESEEKVRQLKQEKDADFEATATPAATAAGPASAAAASAAASAQAAREGEKVPPKTSV